MKNLSKSLLASALALGLTGALHATTLTVSSSAPTPGADDASQLSSAGYTGANDNPPGFNNFYTNDTDDGIGQAFTTGANAGGYDLNSISFKIGDIGDDSNGRDLTFVVYQLGGSGNTTYGTPLFSETPSQTGVADNDWVTDSLSSPVLLSANTTYGVALSTPPVTGEYLQIAWTASSAGGSTVVFNNGTVEYPTAASTAAYDVGLTAVAPEPSTWALMLGGLGLLAFVVRRIAAKA